MLRSADSNAVPAKASVPIDFRFLPNETVDSAPQPSKARSPTDVTFSSPVTTLRAVPPSNVEAGMTLTPVNVTFDSDKQSSKTCVPPMSETASVTSLSWGQALNAPCPTDLTLEPMSARESEEPAKATSPMLSLSL